MATSLDLYLSLVLSADGARDQVGSMQTAFVTIAGDGPSPKGDTPSAVGAAAYKELYDFERDGDFTCILLWCDVDMVVWVQAGTPADGVGTKTDLTWQAQPVPAGVPFIIPTSEAMTNSTAANHVADNSDAPLGFTDAGEVDARVWLVGVEIPGTVAGTVRMARRN
jgi:hypothetical protein